MGALHQGHLSLIKACANSYHVTVCSIFVNPLQFNDPKDFEKYPSTIEADILLLEKNNCTILFLPDTKEIYPEGLNNAIQYNLGEIETVLEGKYRPGHFQGVCRVVYRLLDIIRPDQLYMGQKDYQQCMVVRKMLELTGLSQSVTLNICHTIRKESGLALSSRNMRLDEQQKKQATKIYKSLQFIRDHLKKMPFSEIEEKVKLQLSDNGFEQIDYVAAVNANDLSALGIPDHSSPIVILIAAFTGGIRLIDNMILN
jgi:pantoate--beta-alanine ligase